MERPKGVIGQWYTLKSEAQGVDGEMYPNGFTWPCNEIDYLGEPRLPCGIELGKDETYRLSTPKEIAKAKQQTAITKLKECVTKELDEEYEELTDDERLNFDFDVKDNVNPEHYKKLPKETIEIMVDIWGAEAVALHCQMSAFKYRMRLGHKEGQALEDEVGKIEWYENKARELRG
jgi:hypothetical protein